MQLHGYVRTSTMPSWPSFRHQLHGFVRTLRRCHHGLHSGNSSWLRPYRGDVAILAFIQAKLHATSALPSNIAYIRRCHHSLHSGNPSWLRPHSDDRHPSLHSGPSSWLPSVRTATTIMAFIQANPS